MKGAAERPVVGLFGAFDTGEIGEMALRRVIDSELGRRRPDIDLIALAPFGAEHPVPGDEGRPARPLPRGVGAGALDLDALILSGDVLGDDLSWSARYGVPVEAMSDRGVGALVLKGALAGRDVAASAVWFAVGLAGGEVEVSGLKGKDVWARNPATHERLGGTAAQSGDPVLLASRIFSPDVLRRRADLLRLCGAVPTGRRVVIETSAGLPAPSAERLVEAAVAALGADPKCSVVVVSLNPAKQAPAETPFRVPGVIAERVHVLPAWVGLDDIAAAISGSVGAVATSPSGASLRGCTGRPGSGDRPEGKPPIRPGDSARRRRRRVRRRGAPRREAPGGDPGGGGDSRRRLRRACRAAPAHDGCDPDHYGAGRRRLGAHHPSAAPCGRADSAAG